MRESYGQKYFGYYFPSTKRFFKKVLDAFPALHYFVHGIERERCTERTTMKHIQTFLWCLTLLVLAWLAHQSTIELVVVHRIDFGPTVEAIKLVPSGPIRNK